MKLTQDQSQMVRKSYGNSFLPSRFVTWLTGKPLSGQKPLFRLHWSAYVLVVLGIFFGSLTLGFYNQYQDISVFLTILSWVGLVFSSRRMAAVILHQSVHDRLSGNSKFDKLIGDFVTSLMLTQDYDSYKVDHCDIHHAPRTFATKYDPIVKFFSVFGIDLGREKGTLYRNFFISLFSPLFHLSFFITRLRYNINPKRTFKSIFSISYIALLVYLASLSPNILTCLFLVFIFPLVFLYQISAFIEICSEHAWFDNDVKDKDELQNEQYFYANISWGRFCGSEYKQGMSIIGKFMWYVEQLFFHLPVRMFILVGDLPQHDYHHRKPLSFNWVDAKYNRELAANNLADEEPPYYDIWGLNNAVKHVFNVIAKKSESYILKFNGYAK